MAVDQEVDAVNLGGKFAALDRPWNPMIVGEVNDSALKVVKLEGEFLWHAHDDADELFFVVAGGFTMRLRDRDVTVGEGEFIVVPQGVEHMPVADETCHVLLIEPADLVNTGEVRNARTADPSQRL